MQEQCDLIAYLIETLDVVRNTYPDCGIVLLGDLNNLDISELLNCHNISQVVTVPTRGSATLDLVTRNIHPFYNTPTVLAPIATSDHKIVKWDLKTSVCTNLSAQVCKRQHRCFPQSAHEAFGRWVTSQVLYADGQNLSLEDHVNSFTSNISLAMNNVFPFKAVKLHASDKPWMTAYLKP